MTRPRIPLQPVFESLYEELHATSRADDGGTRSSDHLKLSVLDAALSAARDRSASPQPSASPGHLRYDPGDLRLAIDEDTSGMDLDLICREIGLSPGLTAEEVAALRRQFALRNHPDKAPNEMRCIATRRMMIANALFDAYLAKLSIPGH